MKASHFVPLIILSSFLSISCSKKTGQLDSGDWISRNQNCAEESISDLVKKVKKKSSEAQLLQSTLDEMLKKSPCPVGTSKFCIPELGIQAIATYMSKVTINSSLDKPSKAPVDHQLNEGTITDAIAGAAAGKKRKRNVNSASGSPSKEPPPKGKSLENPELGIDPETLAKKSSCMSKVSPACNFITLEAVIVKLILFTKQARQLEKEILSLLPPPPKLKLDKSDGEKEFIVPDSINKIYLYLKTLESRTQELVFLETAFRRGKKNYIKRYKNLQPEKIKGIIVEIAHTVPGTIGNILKQYIPKVQDRLNYTKKHKSDFKEKINAALKNLLRSKREHGNYCLKQKGCWKFRSCVKRYRLPGITIFKRR